MTEVEREIVSMALPREQLAALLRIEARFPSEIIEAMRQVPRHIFVPPEASAFSYLDRPIAYRENGMDAPVSQPTLIAEMVSRLNPRGKKILEVGTGTGYQAAVISRLARIVYSIDISRPAIELAHRNLARLHINNVRLRSGDGMLGWPQAAPFDGIIVAAAVPPGLPEHLYSQLKPGGRIVMPMTGDFQEALQEFARENNFTDAQVREAEEELRSRCRLYVVQRGKYGKPKTLYVGLVEWLFVPIASGKGQDWW